VEYTTNHDASYRKAVLWLGKKDSVVRRLELYDENERLTKQITATDIRVVGRIPVVFRIEGETMGSSSRTVIQLKNVAFDQGIDDNLFTEGALVRGGK
jgi:outer membrane lipoprotein-sorting protein